MPTFEFVKYNSVHDQRKKKLQYIRISNLLSMVMGLYLPWESLVEGAARDKLFPREV